MNSFNELYTIEELESQGVESQELKRGTTIKYFDKIFVRASNHPKQFRDLALEERNKYIESGLDSFVVESRFYLTIWKEETQPEIVLDITNTSELDIANTNPIISHENLQETQESPEKVPVKEIKILNIKPKIKKYRGSDYL